MKNILRLEELGIFLLSTFLYSTLDYPWWLFLLFLLTPDLGAIGYLVGPRVGAITYNLTHHKGLAATFYILGALLSIPILQLVGIIMLAHSSLDRIFGYGMKFTDSHYHTHLGWVGKAAKTRNLTDEVEIAQ